MITYSQNFEDVMLARLFAGEATGFYVDIGASHPTQLSVTKYFYDLGWNGVNVEPIRRNWKLFVGDRPRDVNLNVAIGNANGLRKFFDVSDNDALSTFDPVRGAQLIAAGHQVNTYDVEVATANAVFDRYCKAEVDFLKVDVEGFEEEVLSSLDLDRHRPRVIVIEATDYVERFDGWKDFDPERTARWRTWEPWLLTRGYLFAYFDGLNRFYVREDQKSLMRRLSIPPGVFDAIVPDLRSTLLRELEEKERVIQQKEATIRAQLRAKAVHERVLEEKETVIKRQSAALTAYRAAVPVFAVFNPLLRLIARCRSIVRPRLGNLNQYAPRKLAVPPHYSNQRLPSAPPRISIVTPSYQHGHYIGETLESVLDQGYPNLEYIVQDGGSRDATVDLLRTFGSRLSSWESRPDNGQSHAINLGFARTSGDIMAWLNSDDLLLPGALAYVADFFVRHPDVDVVYGDRLIIDENGMEIGRWLLPRHDDEILSWVDFIPQETLFWRRSIWEKAGGDVDESFTFAMDWDLLVRFRHAGAKFVHVPRFLGAFRVHAQQKTSSAIADVGHREMDCIRERVLGRVPTHAEIKHAILPYVARHLATDIAFRVRQRL